MGGGADIVVIPERVRLNDKSAAAARVFQKIRKTYIEDMTVFDDPLLVQTV